MNMFSVSFKVLSQEILNQNLFFFLLSENENSKQINRMLIIRRMLQSIAVVFIFSNVNIVNKLRL